MLQCTKMWREFEVDIMYNFADLPIETREMIESVEGKPGFVKLPYDQIYLKYIIPFIPKDYISKFATVSKFDSCVDMMMMMMTTTTMMTLKINRAPRTFIVNLLCP